METKYPTPSRRYRMEHGPYISWFLNNRWIKFRVLSGDEVDLPEDANLIGHKIEEDHLEELYQVATSSSDTQGVAEASIGHKNSK